MLHSFRLKIGLLSVCLSGAIVLAFSWLCLSTIRQLGVERVDRELRALVDDHIRKDQPRGHWRRFEESLRGLYGEDAGPHYIVRVVEHDGEILHVSPHWPGGIALDALPVADVPKASTDPQADSRREESPRERRRRRPFEDDRQRRPPPARLEAGDAAFATVAAGRTLWRIMAIANEKRVLVVGMALTGIEAEVDRFTKAIAVVAPVAFLAMIAGGWLLGHLALRPVNAIARTAESVTAAELGRRVPGTKADAEFTRLIALINGMLERLERSFRQATRFSADAAHELKTPLAILQAQTEQSLQRAADGSAEQRELAEQLEEVQRLRVILRKLLLLSQADSGQLPLSLERFDLAELVRMAAEDVQVLAPGRDVTVETPRELPVMADAALLTQVIDNLVSNAVKFGDEDGAVGMVLDEEGGMAVLKVSNTGVPIPAEDGDRLFDRFYRADKSRSREIEGTGLGLSLAREMARAHGGDLVLVESTVRETTFALTMPLQARGRS